MLPGRAWPPDGSAARPSPLPPGTYKVEVLSDPPVTWDAVVVTTGEPLTLTLPVSTVPTPAP